MTDQTARLLRDAERYLSALHGSVARHDNLAANYGCAGCELRDRLAAELRAPAVPAGQAPATDQAALRDRIAALFRTPPGAERLGDATPGEIADAVLAELPADQAAEVARLRKEHATWQKLGQRNLERAHEENARLRAVLERIRVAVRRLAAHAVGFGDVLDESDRGPWGKTVAADIAELRRMADEAQQPVPTPVALAALYRELAEEAAEWGGVITEHELRRKASIAARADAEPAVEAQQPKEARP